MFPVLPLPSQANQEAAAHAARQQEQIMEQMQTVNRLHEELREVRSKMMTTTESTFASERQLGQLQQAVVHEQEARKRAEQDCAGAQGAGLHHRPWPQPFLN